MKEENNDNLEKKEFHLAGRANGFCQIPNVLFDFWGKIIGAEALRIYCGFKSFIESGRENNRLFPKIPQNDWAEYFGITFPTFNKYIKVLVDVGLIRIKKRRDKKNRQHSAPSIYFLEEIFFPGKEILNKYPVKPLNKENFLNYIYRNYQKEAIKALQQNNETKNSLGLRVLKFLIPADIKNFNEIIEYYKSIEYNKDNSKELYNNPDGLYKKDSLKKQMELEDNLNKQDIPNKQSISNQQITSNKNKQTTSNKKEKRKLSPENERRIRNCPFTMEIINLWSKFAPAVKDHTNPTLPWEDIHRSLNQLRGGTFYKTRNWSGAVFDSFCQINKITPQQIKSMLDRPFKKKEIIEVIEQLPSYCKEGNFMPKQGTLSRMPLSLMFYNERSSFVSMFALALIKGEARPISESMEVKCKYPRLAEKFKKAEDRNMKIDYDKMSVVDKKQFNRIFEEIEERLESIPKEYNYDNPGLDGFIRIYFRELQGLQDLNQVKIELISFSPWSWQWKRILLMEGRQLSRIANWMLEKKDKVEVDRQKEWKRNNTVTDDEYRGE